MDIALMNFERIRKSPKYSDIKVLYSNVHKWLPSIFAPTTILFFIFFLSKIYLNIRPIADDYCYAYLSKFGVVRGTIKQYFSWDGNFFSTFLVISLVGLPLITLGQIYGSMLSLIVMLAGIGCAFSYIIRYLSSIELVSFRRSVIVPSILGTFSYWFFWVSLSSSPWKKYTQIYGNYDLLAEGSLHWKTLQIFYFLNIFLVSAIFIYSLSVRSITLYNVLLLCSLGLLIGGSGYIIAGSLLVTNGMIIIDALRKKNQSIVYIRSITQVSLLSGSLISFFAPGTQIRRSVLNEALGVNRNLIHSFGDSVLYVLSGITSLGFIFSILLGVLIGRFIHLSNLNIQLYRTVIIFSLSLVVFTTIGCYFAGSSPWRYAYLYSLIWLVGTFIGIKIYVRLPSNVLLVSFIFSIFLIYQVSLSSYNSVYRRLEAFRVGSAPTAGIEDTEVSWVRDCATRAGINRD
jgi:hypothetical protein